MRLSHSKCARDFKTAGSASGSNGTSREASKLIWMVAHVFRAGQWRKSKSCRCSPSSAKARQKSQKCKVSAFLASDQGLWQLIWHLLEVSRTNTSTLMSATSSRAAQLRSSRAWRWIWDQVSMWASTTSHTSTSELLWGHQFSSFRKSESLRIRIKGFWIKSISRISLSSQPSSPQLRNARLR